MRAKTKPTILLIDDDPSILKLMEGLFTDDAFEVITSQFPEAALRVVADGRVDCVLIDIALTRTPECFGFMQAARALPGNEALPMVATSAMDEREVATHALALGAMKFFPKPFLPREILREIRSVLS